MYAVFEMLPLAASNWLFQSQKRIFAYSQFADYWKEFLTLYDVYNTIHKHNLRQTHYLSSVFQNYFDFY